jgi:uncharacterized protein YcbK (DUF882 family)
LFPARNRPDTADEHKDIKGISRLALHLGGRSVGLACNIRCRVSKVIFLRSAFSLTATLAGLVALTTSTQDAAANGDTRSLTFFHTHTRESTTVTYLRDGRYDEQALAQLNWFLRDWRVNEPAKMDPRLFDILWEVYRGAGSREPIHIISAYRSPATNGMLRRRSSGVSEHSQHMLGKAMDVRLPDVPTERLRAVAMHLQYGGVGYYSSSQFVHVDTGNVRAWPRMSQEQLVRLFPDGKTLHLPPSGKPLARYDEAKAEILPRNAALAAQASAGGGSIGRIMTALLGRKEPAQPVQARHATEPVPVQFASASPDIADKALALAPIPPRRPKELLPSDGPDAQEPATMAAAAVAATAAAKPEAILGFDQTAAMRALFDPRVVTASIGFSPAYKNDLNAMSFSGPAVKPLSPLRQAQLDL